MLTRRHWQQSVELRPVLVACTDFACGAVCPSAFACIRTATEPVRPSFRLSRALSRRCWPCHVELRALPRARTCTVGLVVRLLCLPVSNGIFSKVLESFSGAGGVLATVSFAMCASSLHAHVPLVTRTKEISSRSHILVCRRPGRRAHARTRTPLDRTNRLKSCV